MSVLVLMVEMELVSEKLVKCNHLMCLSAQEDFVDFGHCESLKTYEEQRLKIKCM
jgi:hypothetical protein